MRPIPSRPEGLLRFFLAGLLVLLVLTPALSASARVPARSAILYNLTTGKVLYAQNADTTIPPASLTKLMTMMLTLDAVRQRKISLKTWLIASRKAARTGGSSMHLKNGERIRLENLLYGMAVVSGNDAAVAAAEKVGGNTRHFVRLMNRKARALGMKHTQFKNVNGLPAAGQRTTARDMLTLSCAYLRAHPSALRYHSPRSFRHGRRLMRATNKLLGVVPGVDGLKTGWTVASGYNIIATAERRGTRLIAVVMGGATAARRDSAARRLLEAGFRYPASPANVERQLSRSTKRR
ncbi:MAG: D-alanyl-D-alanine carboxypeptidase [Desulfovibrio sp.]|uniref:D-alanyl-D-alanine carboxypeptidase family protein n=1 Tax=Desulfovibrio sp. TaxID=885 RepID=UPI0025C12584|nr:D-alanyl-D-alanine carboxypeptidase family protein [Desulfovibrio sp.]MCI7569840.1 D-alanyl-D-alanine carboxypeptidase [Desulfovibrio sp.]